jgi:hypothetical protein
MGGHWRSLGVCTVAWLETPFKASVPITVRAGAKHLQIVFIIQTTSSMEVSSSDEIQSPEELPMLTRCALILREPTRTHET